MALDDYHPPLPLFTRHLETVYPALFRRVRVGALQRERITTPDHDFLDLDWLLSSGKKLVIVSHGLEGNSRRGYVLGMMKAFHDQGFNAVSWNYRGCGDEMNHQLRFYHSGATDDLDCLVEHCVRKGFLEIFLIGFSLGGNLTLKYLGEKGDDIPPHVKGGVAFSVPLNLDSSCVAISRSSNFLYSRRFLRSLKKKILSKAKLMDGLNIEGIDRLNNLRDFDDRYTAPLHGFASANAYYKACSSLYFLDRIRVPTLVVNAQNDPFLGPDCFPSASESKHVSFEYPSHGGHVGFARFGQNGLYWSEARALEFINSIGK
jgi:predicted alpha/beta-fold hydrolase